MLHGVGSVSLEALLGELQHGLAALVDVLCLLEDGLPGLEGGERDALLLAPGDKVLALAREEEIRLPGGAEVADAVARVEQRGPLVEGHLGDGVGVRADGQALVVPEPGVVVELDRPAVGDVERVAGGAGLGLVGHNLDVAHQLLAQQVLEERLEHGNHPTAQHDHGHVVRPRPHHEVAKVRVQRDVVSEDVQHSRERHLPRVEHLLESVAERVGVVDDRVEELPTLFVSHAVVVGDEVIGVLQRDRAVEVGEEDDLRPGVERLGERHVGQRNQGVTGDKK